MACSSMVHRDPPGVMVLSLAGSLTTVDEPESSEELALRFEVIDTGVGIPAAQQERVFEPFSQVCPPVCHLPVQA